MYLEHSPLFNYFQSIYTLKENRLSMADDEILTVKELAEYLKIAEKTAYRFVSEGKIPAFKVGSAWRFRKAEIDRWIAAQEKTNIKNDGEDVL